MNTSMRKIFYYENILEFKKSSQHKLNLQEVNNWQLCRTCLLETNEDDMDMEKMCVMDVVHGDFLTVQQMLLKISPSQVPKDNELPTKVCKDCLGKISNLYFFSMQIEKAQYILTKLFNNLKEDERRATAKGFVELAQKEIRTSTTVVNENVQQVESDDNFNNGSHSNVSCSNSDEVTITEEVMESDTEILWEVESIRSNGNQIDTAEMPSSENEQHVFDTKSINKDKAEIKKDSKIIDNELDIIENLINNCNVIDNKEKDLDEELNVHKNNSIVVYETASSQSDSIIDKNNEEYVVMYATQDDKAKKRKPKQTSVKHKQSRVIKPLLENLKCGVCELTFGRQRDLVRHVSQEHPNSKAYQCRECLLNFSHTQSLSRHMNLHKPMVNKINCEYCSKSFLRADDLKRHIRVHSGERPYACSRCEKAFKQISELKQHMAVHKDGKQYVCEHCDRAFASWNGLYLHKKKHIAENSQADE